MNKRKIISIALACLSIASAISGWAFGIQQCNIGNETLDINCQILDKVNSVLDIISFNHVSINNDVNNLDSEYPVYVSFVYGTESNNYQYETPPQILYSAGEFKSQINNLIPNTKYYFRAKMVTSTNRFSVGEEKIFITSSE